MTKILPHPPRPANLDTTKFSTFYIMRPDGETGKTYWLGIYFNNDQMVRVNNAMKYVVKYAGTGDVEVWTRNEQKAAVTIHAEQHSTISATPLYMSTTPTPTPTATTSGLIQPNLALHI